MSKSRWNQGPRMLLPGAMYSFGFPELPPGAYRQLWIDGRWVRQAPAEPPEEPDEPEA